MTSVRWVRRLRPLPALILLVVASLPLASREAEAGWLCRWFKHCVYESPGFRLTVVDKETGDPLAGVHALAEWVLYGPHGRNGPLMVQDTTSGPDGVLSFPPWGPIDGSRLGIIPNQDPALSLFKPGYRVLALQNSIPIQADETKRVRGFREDGARFVMERFQGSQHAWMEELRKAAYPPFAAGLSNEQMGSFRDSYLHRRRQVWNELSAIETDDVHILNFVRAFADSLRRMEEFKK